MQLRQRGSVQPWRDRSNKLQIWTATHTHTSHHIYNIISSLSFRQASPLLFLPSSPLPRSRCLTCCLSSSPSLSQTELVGRLSCTVLTVWTLPQAVCVNRNRADLGSALHIQMCQNEKYIGQHQHTGAQTDPDNSLLDTFYDAALEWKKI